MARCAFRARLLCKNEMPHSAIHVARDDKFRACRVGHWFCACGPRTTQFSVLCRQTSRLVSLSIFFAERVLDGCIQVGLSCILSVGASFPSDLPSLNPSDDVISARLFVIPTIVLVGPVNKLRRTIRFLDRAACGVCTQTLRSAAERVRSPKWPAADNGDKVTPCLYFSGPA
jgi:hypothetical protein